MGNISRFADYQQVVDQPDPPKEFHREIFSGQMVRVFHNLCPVDFKSKQLRHFHCNKRLIVVDGILQVVFKNGVQRIHKDDQVLVPATELHQLQNIGRIPLELIEIRTGTYLEDDELIRV